MTTWAGPTSAVTARRTSGRRAWTRRLAAGCAFTDGYSAAAVCSPTRFGLYTGRYPGRLPGGHPALAAELRTRWEEINAPLLPYA